MTNYNKEILSSNEIFSQQKNPSKSFGGLQYTVDMHLRPQTFVMKAKTL